MIEEAGCSILTVHGRQRDRALHHAPANWATIRAVREALRIPVIANGGIDSRAAAERCLAITGCAGVMVATALLADPELFIQSCTCAPASDASTKLAEGSAESVSDLSTDVASDVASDPGPTEEASKTDRCSALRRSVRQCLRYLELCEEYPPATLRAPRDHLRAILACFCGRVRGHALETSTHADIFESFDAIGASRLPLSKDDKGAFWQEVCQRFRDVIHVLCLRLDVCIDGEIAFEGHLWVTQPGHIFANPSTLDGAAALVDKLKRETTGTAGSTTATALARRVDTSKRFNAALERRKAALSSFVAAGKKSSNRGKCGK